jgi:hypothetical protein
MNKVDELFPAAKPDLVAAFMRQVIAMSPGFSAALASQIEAEFRVKHAGVKFVVLKRGAHLTPEKRAAVFRDGLTRMTDEEISQKHGISPRTLARIMKGL